MRRIILTALVALMTLTAGARDKNFHIFICIGQSIRNCSKITGFSPCTIIKVKKEFGL